MKVFKEDMTGAVSLEVVRLLNRMIKERKYRVNSNTLSCLLHLRLDTGVGVRASNLLAEKQPVKNKGKEKYGRGTASRKIHLSKRVRKVVKEKEAIRSEMKEAEMEVDKEERSKAVRKHHTHFLCAEVFFSARRNVEARLRSLLPDSQAPIPDAAPARRATRNRQILAPSQH